MIALLQRVTSASVDINAERVAAIGTGLLVLVGVQRGDDERSAERLAERLANYRVFPDAEGKMNLSITDVRGALLLVPQFTLAADTAKGTRPSFTPAAAPDVAARLFEHFVACLRSRQLSIACGRFGADMDVTLINQGPVTFWLTA